MLLSYRSPLLLFLLFILFYFFKIDTHLLVRLPVGMFYLVFKRAMSVLQIPTLDLNLIPIRRTLARVATLLEATVTRTMIGRQ